MSNNEAKNESNNASSKENIKITPTLTYTPLSQDSKPYISKRFQKSNEQINNNENKRNNFIKKK